jgi:hypothetical protein
MSILLVKLGGIFVKQLSKPVANRLSAAVLANATLRQTTVQAAQVRPTVLNASCARRVACDLLQRVALSLLKLQIP